MSKGYEWLKSKGVTAEDFAEVMPFSQQKTVPNNWANMEITQSPAHVPEVWSGDGIVRTHEQCLAWAEALNCDIRFPQPDELFIDIDTEAAWHRFLITYECLDKFIKCSCVITASKSGLPKRHVVVKLDKHYSITERIALQAIMGSDPMRELMSLKRVRDDENYDTIICFFEPKVVAQP